MNITLQTNNFNSNQNIYNRNIKQNNTKRNSNISYNSPSFSGKIEVPTDSKVLSPLKGISDKFTTWLSDKYTYNLYTSKLAKYLASKTDNLKSVVDHMQVLGSVIISGMYMTQTLRNQGLDENRRRTLAINQGLTFALSTIGSYAIDDALDSKWEKLTTKYAAKETGIKDLEERIKEFNKNKLNKHNADIANGIIEKGTKFKPANVLEYASKELKNADLEVKLNGMGVLKKLLVFGTVYRFIAPVAVTPFATWMGNKLNAHHGNKQNGNLANNNLDKKA